MAYLMAHLSVARADGLDSVVQKCSYAMIVLACAELRLGPGVLNPLARGCYHSFSSLVY